MHIIKGLQRYSQTDAVEIAAQFTLLTLLFTQVGNAFSRPFLIGNILNIFQLLWFLFFSYNFFGFQDTFTCTYKE